VTGDFHTQGNNEASAPLKKLLEELFPEDLVRQLRNRKQRDLNMMVVACGSFWGHLECRQALRSFVKRYTFLCSSRVSHVDVRANLHHTIGFGAKEVMGGFLGEFAGLVMDLFFAQGIHEYLKTALKLQARTGTHTDILWVNAATVKRYVFSHPGRQPFGCAGPQFCKCGTWNEWTRPPKDKPLRVMVIWECKRCHWQKTFMKPDGLKEFARIEGTQQIWYEETLGVE
jgi:hypothetical protein